MTGIMSINMPSFLNAVNYLSPIRYAIRNLAPYTLRGLHFTCTASQEVNGVCPITTGKQVLDLYNLDGSAGLNLMALGVATVIYRVLAYALLKGMKTRWRQA